MKELVNLLFEKRIDFKTLGSCVILKFPEYNDMIMDNHFNNIIDSLTVRRNLDSITIY